MEWVQVKDWPEPTEEELSADARRQRNAREHCPGCGRFVRPPKIRFILSFYGQRRVAEGVCRACGEFDIPLD